LVLIQLGEQGRLSAYERLTRHGSHLVFSLQVPIGAYVEKFMAAFSQYTPNQKAAMAMGRIFFSAKEGYTKICNAALQPLNARRKSIVRLDATVEHMTLSIVVIRILWATAQLSSEEKIPDAGLSQSALQNLTVKLRSKMGIGRGTSVHHNIDPVRHQKSDEHFVGVRGMSNSVDATHRRSLAQA
jgi:hypothetical protein